MIVGRSGDVGNNFFNSAAFSGCCIFFFSEGSNTTLNGRAFSTCVKKASGTCSSASTSAASSITASACRFGSISSITSANSLIASISSTIDASSTSRSATVNSSTNACSIEGACPCVTGCSIPWSIKAMACSSVCCDASAIGSCTIVVVGCSCSTISTTCSFRALVTSVIFSTSLLIGSAKSSGGCSSSWRSSTFFNISSDDLISIGFLSFNVRTSSRCASTCSTVTIGRFGGSWNP